MTKDEVLPPGAFVIDWSFVIRASSFPPQAGYTTPWSIIAFATLRKPAMLAPLT